MQLSATDLFLQLRKAKGFVSSLTRLDFRDRIGTLMADEGCESDCESTLLFPFSCPHIALRVIVVIDTYFTEFDQETAQLATPVASDSHDPPSSGSLKRKRSADDDSGDDDDGYMPSENGSEIQCTGVRRSTHTKKARKDSLFLGPDADKEDEDEVEIIERE
jgi:hypothetical protein